MFYLIADATPDKWEAPTCFAGEANVTTVWIGAPEYEIIYTNGGWKGYIWEGDFGRDIMVDVNIRAPENSQFHSMIVAEELFHEKQFKGIDSTNCLDFWVISNVFASACSNQPFIGSTATAVENLMMRKFNDAREEEERRTNELYFSRRCAVEEEAKRMAGASHCVKLECTYPECVP